MKRLNVALIKYDMTEKSGGDRVAANLSNALSDYFNVHLVSINGKGEKPYFNLNEKVIYAPLLFGHERIRKTFLKGGKELRKYAKENSIDVMLTIGGNVNFFMWYSCRKTDIKQIFCEHINLFSALKSRSDKPMRELAAKTADKIITLTEKDRDYYIRHFSLDKERVQCIPNWVDDKLLLTESNYSIGSKKFITVGRLEDCKGFDLLCDVASKVFQKHPDWKWEIWGDGPDKEKIKEYIKSAGLTKSVMLMGTSDNLYSIYPEYSVYVMTSRMEGLPMVLLEAKANCLPTVSFDCMTGPAEIIEDGVSGYLISDFNTELMARKLNYLIENEEEREKFSIHAKDNLNKFEKENIVSSWVSLIKDC